MDREISASEAAGLLGTAVRTVQGRIMDGRIAGRHNRVNGRMFTTPGACLAYIRVQAGENSPEEADFLARLEKSRELVEQSA